MLEVACIGAGTVGSAWAVVFARAGYRVALYDRDAAISDDAVQTEIRESLALLDANGLLEDNPATVATRIRVASTLQDAVASAAYVQESVREDVAIKREVFAEIARHAPSDCLLASSTSAIKGSEFLGAIDNPGRAIVAHPVNPPSLIPLVELCLTPWTTPECLAAVRALLEAAGMRPITLEKEIDGFILNRLQYTLVAEAMHLVGEGYCSPQDIDRAMTDGLALRWASIGPFEVAHLNAAGGFRGFVDQLGGMMKTMGRSAQTDYDWDQGLVDKIHAALTAETPVANIPARQNWRNRKVLATRQMQATDSSADQLASDALPKRSTKNRRES